MTFEDTKEEWEAHDDWQFADRDAERRYFYREGMMRAAEIAKKFVKDNHAWRIIKGKPLKLVSAIDAIREEAERGE